MWIIVGLARAGPAVPAPNPPERPAFRAEPARNCSKRSVSTSKPAETALRPAVRTARRSRSSRVDHPLPAATFRRRLRVFRILRTGLPQPSPGEVTQVLRPSGKRGGHPCESVFRVRDQAQARQRCTLRTRRDLRPLTLWRGRVADTRAVSTANNYFTKLAKCGIMEAVRAS